MDRNQRRDEIFHAALVAFARFGYQKTTMEDVAGALGMTKGNLYFYVSGKRDLYEKTVSSALQQWREAVAIAVTPDLVPEPDSCAYDGTVVAVAHQQYRDKAQTTAITSDLGAKNGCVVYDLKSVLPRTDSVMRL